MSEGLKLPMFVVGMLHDVKNERWHPIYFRYAPPPSGDLDSAGRYRSVAHHTQGFADQEEANKNAELIKEALEKQEYTVQMNIEKSFAWDGDGDTAVKVTWFSSKGVPVL